MSFALYFAKLRRAMPGILKGMPGRVASIDSQLSANAALRLRSRRALSSAIARKP